MFVFITIVLFLLGMFLTPRYGAAYCVAMHDETPRKKKAMYLVLFILGAICVVLTMACAIIQF